MSSQSSPSPARRLARAPVRFRAEREPSPEPTPLRLSVTRGGLGIELYQPLTLAPLTVTGLCMTLPGLRFPLDLSGGVPAFRHRRGDLESVALQARPADLAEWIAPRLGAVIGELVRPVSLWCRPDVIGVGIAAEDAALAFELQWAPLHGDARFVVARARGVGLNGPALGYALRAVDSVLGNLSQRRGRVVTIERVGQLVGRAVLPTVGARAPAARRVRFGELRADDRRLATELDATLLPPVLADAAARSLELAELSTEADQALASGELESARDGYLAALEQAPRHPELVQLVAEIDLCSGGREQAALGMLVETMQAVRAGWTGARLLAGVGDWEAARAAVLDAAREERYPPLAALLFVRLAELEPDPRAKAAALDRAVACSPALPRARWARFEARAQAGQIEDALADAQHLEAAASGARARHVACRRAAASLLELGYVRDAGKLFERALRYLPDDAAATAGLARSLIESGHADRAFSLLERAVQLSERSGRADPDALTDLARLVAERLSDLPQAIARVRQVTADSPRVVEARALEGRWRARLGDRVGASLAFGRLRETIELATEPGTGAAEFLLEAARFEREVQDDVVAAERHLAVALRIAPLDAVIGRAYREVGAALADARRRSPARADASADAAPPDLAALAAEAERLQSALQADPGDVEVALQLIDLLDQLGRDHELFALVSARLEDADPVERDRLTPRARAVLARLRDEALAAGRESEARLYNDALDQL